MTFAELRKEHYRCADEGRHPRGQRVWSGWPLSTHADPRVDSAYLVGTDDRLLYRLSRRMALEGIARSWCGWRAACGCLVRVNREDGLR
jgi:hypothetical protein